MALRTILNVMPSRAALRALPLLGEPVDILHGNDWQCGFAIVELKLLNSDPFYSRTRSLQTIHNLAYQGIFKQDELAKLGLSSALNYFDWYGQASALKAGLMAADRLSTVSRRYAEEIQTKEFGCGLEGILSHRSSDLSGITNGIDQDVWNPKTDRHIKAHYSYEDLSGKSVCREDLLATYGLSTNQKPVVGSISRLVSQKGFDLIQEASDQIMATGISFVALGSGEPRFENFLEELRARYPDRVGIYRGYNEALAHKIEAGADIFLMPSQFEPCGLNQMYSMRYGTVPIVRKTGGLDDTVTGYDSRREGSTGFKFEKYTSDALLASFREAVECYGNRGIWRNLQINGMKMDNSWEAAAGKYIEIYQRLAKI
jgi:starch synthase